MKVFTGHNWISILTRDHYSIYPTFSSRVNKTSTFAWFYPILQLLNRHFAFSRDIITAFQKYLKRWLITMKLIIQLCLYTSQVFRYYTSTKFPLIFIANCYWVAALNISWMRCLLTLIDIKYTQNSKITKLKTEWK